ncbi:ferric reductase-like transmembrane domain-containing protein [Archangium lipolyticum]|uniref:ferric reductase-like transmembrane domain-containing protein n=1 Tax=Archangium lipolyticum TaxID=2970465 RepID=UPI00214A7F27|nr:ferric reductase-like transmembrane domain-containing protein [Archangium lipolyticum]
MNTKVPSITGWKLFWLIGTLVLAMSALLLALNADPVEGTRSVIRATARTSFALFLAAFVASSLNTLVPSDFTRRLMRERRYVGLSFAFSHLVHLMAIFSYGVLNPQFWPSRNTLTNTPGTVGYVFIALLAITSFHVVSRHMTAASWKRLHTVGMWVIAAIFGYSFFKRIPTMSVLYAIPFSMLCAAVAVRLVGKWAQANKRRQAHARGSYHNVPSPNALESLS